jgi:hypothetical protein
VHRPAERREAHGPLSPGHHAAADVGCLYGLNTQHDPWRASALAWRTGGNDKVYS